MTLLGLSLGARLCAAPVSWYAPFNLGVATISKHTLLFAGLMHTDSGELPAVRCGDLAHTSTCLQLHLWVWVSKGMSSQSASSNFWKLDTPHITKHSVPLHLFAKNLCRKQQHPVAPKAGPQHAFLLECMCIGGLSHVLALVDLANTVWIYLNVWAAWKLVQEVPKPAHNLGVFASSVLVCHGCWFMLTHPAMFKSVIAL